ncbi:hypothetical protein L083_1696 [Actinoplanes sp. N902-109]|nr:hypothetical protein L083_1696 [Actinoplanes sp. N902-109]
MAPPRGNTTGMTDQKNPTPGDPDEDHPAQEAHGGSMAPGLVTDTGEPEQDTPPADAPTPAEE